MFEWGRLVLHEAYNFMAAKLKVSFFVLLQVALFSITAHLIGVKQRKLCWYVKFSQWKGQFWIQNTEQSLCKPLLFSQSTTNQVSFAMNASRFVSTMIYHKESARLVI